MNPAPETQRFYAVVSDTVFSLGMLEKNDRVLAAVSGGPDSVALVLALMFMRSDYPMEIGIAHLNHRLRGEDALRDEDFVRNLAQRFDLPFFFDRKDVRAYARCLRLSVEEAGRRARYDFFSETARKHGYRRIATGHNRNDNAEMVLMNLIRGSGLRGIAGIPPVRDPYYIRPLIRLAREDILGFLDAENQVFRIDATNTDTDILRNSVRHRLIPWLAREYNPGIVDALDRLSRIVRQADEFMDTECERCFQACLADAGENAVSFSGRALSGLHPAMQNRVIRMGIGRVKKDLRRISLAHLEAVSAFCASGMSGGSLDLPGRIRIYRKKDRIMIRREERPLREIGRADKSARRLQKDPGGMPDDR